MQTTVGINTATVRQTFVSAGRVDLFIEEERSLDNEIGHVPEEVAVLALSTGIIDGFIIDLFDENTVPQSGGRFGGAILPGLITPLASTNAGLPDSQSIQQMILARERFVSLGDSVFEQLDDSTLIHVDIDASTALAIAGSIQLNPLQSSSQFDSTNQQSNSNSSNSNSSNSNSDNDSPMKSGLHEGVFTF